MGMKQMHAQWINQRIGQDGEPVLVALAAAYDNLPLVEINVLTRKRRHSSRRIPVPYNRRAIRPCTPSMSVQSPGFLCRQNHGNPFRLLRTLDLTQPRKLKFQYFAEEEQQSRKRLLMRRRCNVARPCQPGKKATHLLSPHLAWMTLAVELHKTPDSLDISLFGSYAVVLVAGNLAHPLQQPDRLRRHCALFEGRRNGCTYAQYIAAKPEYKTDPCGLVRQNRRLLRMDLWRF